ncbi:CheB methylesterase domain-containing protein [Cuneatibacter sp. NSJ-177]|uniref:CheB methylesterase domain-containing protein n=1 Tax=Cuneatibacter sp. NSJ-177 TaxID=2931401 RepID=UPI001FD45552|nr:CheB methylesterase domain-containing protein [Cuneatibacter sp. NSJ-177]MCJ7835925.1 CheB methylesterase domain-containing protein [Cuneatibacter sp. NSJ-177]
MAEPKKVGICAETTGIRKFLWEAIEVGGLRPRGLGDLLSQDAGNMLEGLSCVVVGGHTEAFLKRIRERIEGYTSIPVILLADVYIKERSTLQAEWIHLESFEDEKSRSGAGKVLQVKIKAGNARRREAVNSLPSRCLVGIGSSAGGPKALAAILKNLTESCCGILIVQHIAKGFSQMLAEYLNAVSAMRVKVAEEGEVVRDGTAYLAVHGQQLTVEKKGALFLMHRLSESTPQDFCPSIDMLFRSLAVSAGERAAGILLTGMGEDGAKGLQEMRSAGAYTVAQDRESSEIYGMPKAAVALGGVCRQLPLSEIPAAVMEFAGRWRHG